MKPKHFIFTREKKYKQHNCIIECARMVKGCNYSVSGFVCEGVCASRQCLKKQIELLED